MKPIDTMSDEQLLQQLHQAVRALPDAPLHWQRAAIDLWAQRAVPAQPALTALARAVLRQISAVLSFDSWATPGLAQGMRSLRSPTRHLLYSAEGRDIDLRVAASATAQADTFSLAGQILGPDQAGEVELASSEAGTVHQAQLDALGEFRIDGLARGTYAMTLKLGAELVVLPPLAVGASTAAGDDDSDGASVD